MTEQIYEMKGMMTSFVDMDGLSGKYGTMSNDELLKEYREEELVSDFEPQAQSDLIADLRKSMKNGK